MFARRSVRALVKSRPKSLTWLAMNRTAPTFDDDSLSDDFDAVGLGDETAAKKGHHTPLMSEAFLARASEQASPSSTSSPTSSAALLDGEEAMELCVKCGAPQEDPHAAWCLACGYYPQLDMVVELDQEVEAMAKGAPIAPAVSPFSVVPLWAWTIGIGVLAIIGGSFSAWSLAPEGSRLQMIWGCSQAAGGALIFLTAHIAAFLRASVAGDAVSFVDIVTQPLALWKFTIGKLPKSWPHIAIGVWSLVAADCAVLIVGGIPYERFWDWGIEERADRNTSNAIASQLGSGSGEEMSMEEAMDEFAGDAGVGGLIEGEKEEVKAPVFKDVDCMIVGYLPLDEAKTDVSSFVVAAVFHGKLQYVATVPVELPRSQVRDVMRRLKQRETERPSVRNNETAVWIRPGMVCRVKYLAQDKKTGRLREAEFDGMLADIPGYR